MGAVGIGLIVVLGIIFFIFIWYFSTYNGIKTSDLKVSEALSGIDVALTKRYDVLTKMLDTVRGYMSYEKQTLADIVRLRSGMTMGGIMLDAISTFWLSSIRSSDQATIL